MRLSPAQTPPSATNLSQNRSQTHENEPKTGPLEPAEEVAADRSIAGFFALMESVRCPECEAEQDQPCQRRAGRPEGWVGGWRIHLARVTAAGEHNPHQMDHWRVMFSPPPHAQTATTGPDHRQTRPKTAPERAASAEEGNPLGDGLGDLWRALSQMPVGGSVVEVQRALAEAGWSLSLGTVRELLDSLRQAGQS